jgi:hypothetical protein
VRWSYAYLRIPLGFRAKSKLIRHGIFSYYSLKSHKVKITGAGMPFCHLELSDFVHVSV